MGYLGYDLRWFSGYRIGLGLLNRKRVNSVFLGSFWVILGQGLEDLSNFGSGRVKAMEIFQFRVGSDLPHDLDFRVSSGQVVVLILCLTAMLALNSF